jgi:hypothetical protein
VTTFTVTDATLLKDIPDGQYGPAKVFMLKLQEYGQQPVEAEWYTKAATPLPAAGSSIEGDLEQTQYGLKFKRARTGTFAGRPGRSPEETKQIVRQHSQHMALLYLTAKALAGKLEANPKPSELVPLIDFFDRDAREGWKNADARKPLPKAPVPSDVPNDFPAPPTGGPDALGDA